MRQLFCIFFLITLTLAACAPVQMAEPTQAVTPTVLSTSTATPIPPTFTASPTFTPSPTPELPVGPNTAIPELSVTITANDLMELKEIARYYGNLPYIAKLTKDRTRLFVRDQVGIDVYNFQTKKLLLHIEHYAMPNGGIALQVSNDGERALIDNRWLLRLTGESTEVALEDIYARKELSSSLNGKNIALSSDGQSLAIHEYKCDEVCLEIFHFLRLDTDEFVAAPSMGGFDPVFSPDNSMIAMRASNQVVVWKLSDGTRVNEFPIDRFTLGVVFSDDSSRLAIRQLASIDLWNLESGKKVKSIPSNADACSSATAIFGSVPVFGPNSQLAVFDCKGKVEVWSATGILQSQDSYDVSLPSVFFDDRGKISLLAPPYSAGPWNGYENYLLNDILFLDNETIGFQYFDSGKRAYRGCTLDLQGGDQNCADNLFFGTDKQVYKYTNTSKNVRLFSAATSQSLYDFPWSGLQPGTIYGFDPGHSLLLYRAYPTQYTSETSLLDLETGEVLSKWDKRGVSAVAFSEDSQVAALCLDLTGRGITFFTNKGKLSLINLANQTIAYEEAFACSHVVLSHASENRQLAASYEVLPPGSKFLKSMLMIMSFDRQTERRKIDIGCDRNIGALAYSPDDALLVAGCLYGNSNGIIHFLNAADGTPLYQVAGYPGVSGLAFSPDGKMLTISFGGGVISTLAILSP